MIEMKLYANGAWVALASGSVSSAADDITTGDGAVSIATSAGNVTIDSQAAGLILDGHTGITLQNASGDILIDSAADIVLDAAGNDFSFKSAGTEFLRVTNSSGDAIIKPIVDAKDIIFQQRDGTEVARIEDNGTFNVVAGKLAINGTAITSTAAELNILDGVTTSAAELNFVDGVTSNIQDQLDDKAPLASPTFTGTVNAAALTLSGDLIVSGTTTTVNSTTVTLDDPIITLGGDTAPGSDDNKDRGVEFRWHDGTGAKTGFFGFDDSNGYFGFIPNATNTSEVFTGTLGDFQATNFRGDLIGNADTATTVTTNADLTGDITSSGNATAIASGVIVNGDINASAGIVDTKLATISTASKVSNSATTATSANTASAIVARDASGNFSAGTITAALTGNADTVTTNANLTGHITSSGNAAVLGSFTSAQLSAALTDETGSGAAVFATSPTLVTPALGTPSSGNLSSCTVASASAKGVVELATAAEVIAGTETAVVITPDTLAAKSVVCRL
jgi:hypothetical protein